MLGVRQDSQSHRRDQDTPRRYPTESGPLGVPGVRLMRISPTAFYVFTIGTLGLGFTVLFPLCAFGYLEVK